MRSAVFLLTLALASPAVAQVIDNSKLAPESENGRFTMSPVAGGVMRMDTRTGKISICRQKGDAWACEAAADDRGAYEQEIARLQDKVAKLERELRTGDKTEMKLPSDAEVDKAMTFFENILRRFKSMIDNLQREDGAKRT
ncbi:MAG TPA: hypothetical protein VNQ34_03560 [Xanthobacteraceae bacterium]|jgi:hypothetical protein|nr:hypothetical protein [Xanthobacteraceae bacterium]